MKRILLLFLGVTAQWAFAQSAGFNNTFVVLSIGGSQNLYYDLNGNTSNYDFNGQTLGTFCQGSQELILKGGENNVWKCNGCDVTATGLNYRIYPTGSAGGSFSYTGFGYASGNNNGCGGADQMWNNTSNNINLISGLAAGNYTIEVYSDASTSCWGTLYASNGGQNYKAYFTVNATSAGGSLSGQSVCYGNNPADVALTAQTGTVTKWQRSTVADFSSNVIDINSTATTLSGSSIGAIVQTVYLRAEVKSGVCAPAYSSVAALVPVGNSWTGVLDSDWNNPANWSCGSVPNATTDVTIPTQANNPIVSESAAVKTLTVMEGAVVNVATGATLIVSNALTNNGQLIVENNGALVQQTGSIYSGSGTATVYRNSNALKRLDYTMWAAPVIGQNLLEFSPLTFSSNPSRFYTYGILGNGAEGYLSVIPANTSFAPATGYLIRTPNVLSPNDPDYNAGNATYVHEGTFTGTLNNGTINVTGLFDHYMAVGNPYASPISVQEFLSQNSGVISGTIYLWRKRNDTGGSSNSYVQINNTGYVENTAEGGDIDGGIATFYGPGTNTADWILSPGQGFIVGVQNAGDITFTNSMRVAAPTSGSQPFFRTSNTNDIPTTSKWWLNLSGPDNLFSQALVAYMPQATLGIDYGYDGTLFTDVTTRLYTTEGNAGFSIQARPQFTDTDVVKLSFAVPAAGQFTLATDRVTGVFAEGQSIYIKDNLLGTTHLLGEEGYTFTSDAGTFESRFEVVYQIESALGSSQSGLENAVMVYQANGAINISTGSIEMESVTVYDALGRRLYAQTGIGATQASITNLDATEQVLVVEIDTAAGKVIKKIVY